MPSWARRTTEGWLIAVHVQPGAKKNEIAGLHGDALKIRVAAPALEGKANAAVITLIAERVGVAKSRVRVLRGERSREKQIEILAPEIAADERLAPVRGDQ